MAGWWRAEEFQAWLEEIDSRERVTATTQEHGEIVVDEPDDGLTEWQEKMNAKLDALGPLETGI